MTIAQTLKASTISGRSLEHWVGELHHESVAVEASLGMSYVRFLLSY